MVLLNGPVKNALFCLMDRYQNVCVWFMARNCRFPKVGTHCCQRGNHRLLLQRNCRVSEVGTHGSQPGNQRLPLQATARSCWEPRVAIAKNFQFLKVGTDGSQRGNQRLPWQGTAGSQTLKLTVCNLGTRGYHCKELPVPRN